MLAPNTQHKSAVYGNDYVCTYLLTYLLILGCCVGYVWWRRRQKRRQATPKLGRRDQSSEGEAPSQDAGCESPSEATRRVEGGGDTPPSTLATSRVITPPPPPIQLERALSSKPTLSSKASRRRCQVTPSKSSAYSNLEHDERDAGAEEREAQLQVSVRVRVRVRVKG